MFIYLLHDGLFGLCGGFESLGRATVRYWSDLFPSSLINRLWSLWNLSPRVSLGNGDSSVVRAPDSRLKGGGFESLHYQQEKFLLQGRNSVLSFISVSVPPPGDRLQLNTHELTWCMAVWCTQNAPRWQQFHVAPAMPEL